MSVSALDAFPEKARDLVMEGNAWEKNGNDVAAAFSYLKALEISPGMPEIYQRLGMTFEALDMNVAATRVFERYLAIGMATKAELEDVRQRLMDLRVKSAA